MSVIPRAFILITLSFPSLLQSQEYKGPIWGGSGGTSSYNLDCGSTGVMVGVYGKSGTWIDQVGISCRTVKSDGTLGTTYTRGPVGGSGGSGGSANCPSGSVVGNMGSTSGSYMNQVAIQCFAWIAATRRYDGNQYKGIYTFGAGLTPLSIGMANNTVVSCPDGMVAKALRGKYGSYIDSMQFVCDAWNK